MFGVQIDSFDLNLAGVSYRHVAVRRHGCEVKRLLIYDVDRSFVSVGFHDRVELRLISGDFIKLRRVGDEVFAGGFLVCAGIGHAGLLFRTHDAVAIYSASVNQKIVSGDLGNRTVVEAFVRGLINGFRQTLSGFRECVLLERDLSRRHRRRSDQQQTNDIQSQGKERKVSSRGCERRHVHGYALKQS